MTSMKVVPLGAGQDVGRSCVIVSLGGKNIMFDCGMHMGYQDERRFPDFSFLSQTGRFDQIIDCVIISHFHLDHCGALPHFTEVRGYNGPVYMTYPTKAICPILLEDYRKITVEKKGDANFFKAQDIKNCMKKVIAVNLHQTIKVDDELEIRAYYAGHVLGAAMFYARVGEESVVYTGDYNMTPDRHLGAAWIDKLRPDLLITETTYATTIRDSKRSREHDFLKRVHKTVERGGKVLIPVFALGRAQELCILLDTYWERMNLGSIPIYFAAGLTEKANLYYKLFIGWTNQKIKKTFVRRNMFDFKHIRPFDRSYADHPGPMVLFATPGMLHAGLSLEVFKKWAGSELNMVILPGYCVVGTVGNKLLAGQTPCKVEIDKKTVLDVRCKVKSLSFSAHADAKGIMQLIRQADPRNVLLVHGEKGKMNFLKQRIVREFGINCYDPPNGTSVSIPTRRSLPVELSTGLLKRQLILAYDQERRQSNNQGERVDTSFSSASASSSLSGKKICGGPIDKVSIQGLLVMKENQMKLLDPSETSEEIGLPEHQLSFGWGCDLPDKYRAGGSFPSSSASTSQLLNELLETLSKSVEDPVFSSHAASLRSDVSEIERRVAVGEVEEGEGEGEVISVLNLHSIAVELEKQKNRISMSWSFKDDDLATHVLLALQQFVNNSR